MFLICRRVECSNMFSTFSPQAIPFKFYSSLAIIFLFQRFIYVHRYHGIEIVNFDSERGGVSLEQEKTETGTTSRLLLTKATFRDSGNYTCKTERALPATVTVHVLNGMCILKYRFTLLY